MAKVKIEKVVDKVFTYIGSLDSPRTIKFMGQIDFEIDKPVTVDGTKTLIINKLKGHRCFIEGEITDKVRKTRSEKEKKEKDRIIGIQEKHKALEQSATRRRAE